jgi:hypothetical protein
MMAVSKKTEDQPSEIEMLLPFHAAGTLDARDARRVEEALARNPDLAQQYAVVQEEYADTIHLNEGLGAPSVRAMQKLFAAIDAEPPRRQSVSFSLSARITEFFASLSPRTLAWSGSVGALALLLQAGVIGAVLVNERPVSYQTASLSNNESITRNVRPATLPQALVRFEPEARVMDITALLERYQASIVDGAKGGIFRVQFGDKSISKDEVSKLINRLEREKIVTLAVPVQ